MKKLVALPALLVFAACGTDPVGIGGVGDASLLDDVGGGDAGGSDLGGGSDTDGTDAGGSDGGSPDAVISFDVGGGDDTGTLVDAGGEDVVIIEDAGSPDTTVPPLECEPGSTACEGPLLLTCADDGTWERSRCEGREVCRTAADGSAACGEAGANICEPLALRCSPTEPALQQCTERGIAWETVERCDGTCDPDTLSCVEDTDPPDPEACEDIETIEPGSFRVDLCGAGNDTELQPTEDGECGESAGEGEDLIFAFTLDEPATVILEALDDDDTAAIDTIVAIRSACDRVASQVACHDDVPCNEATEFDPRSCSGDRQPRHARIVTSLEAGTWYAVIDHFDYSRNGTSFRCGEVDVRLEIR